ncbi:MAG: ATP-binding protein [Jatrophihabitantaceae bacterium]
MGAIQVRHEPSSAALVRRRLTDDLAHEGVDPDSIDEVVLVASELVGNAVRHTPVGPLDVTWDLDPNGVTVRVSDPSTTLPTLRTPLDTEPGGRGLTIVAAVSDDWGAYTLGSGKRVWAHVPVRRAVSAS